jgi:hypothetical protein
MSAWGGPERSRHLTVPKILGIFSFGSIAGAEAKVNLDPGGAEAGAPKVNGSQKQFYASAVYIDRVIATVAEVSRAPAIAEK